MVVGLMAGYSTVVNYSNIVVWFSCVLEDPVGGMDRLHLAPEGAKRATLLPDEPKQAVSIEG